MIVVYFLETILIWFWYLVGGNKCDQVEFVFLFFKYKIYKKVILDDDDDDFEEKKKRKRFWNLW